MTGAPIVRLAAELSGGSVWHTLEHHGQATSTSELAWQRASSGCLPGLIVVADHQTAGRGRRGRRWDDRGEDAAGSSLLASLLLRGPREHVSLTPLAAGLAMLDAVDRVTAGASLKWPNDVLLASPAGERKCAGVLVERRGGRADRPPRVVVGVGCNVDWRGLEPATGSAEATSLAEASDGDVDRWELLVDLVAALPGWLSLADDDPERLRAAYTTRCSTLGRTVEVATDGDHHVGRAETVAADGALVVSSGAGGRLALRAGDVTRVRSLA